MRKGIQYTPILYLERVNYSEKDNLPARDKRVRKPLYQSKDSRSDRKLLIVVLTGDTTNQYYSLEF